ncbi:THO complex protein 7 [Drosophila grimshawi]|uniref:GH15660 n=1 Tax=Drosophila grimshawi TaxID=7222 RepID=B4IZR8_DROGR|nr:THO complex protein 7 [Drosophila grimshawi]EDV95653.1 GH15660 [Drosophila grimshawi]
MNDEEIIKQRLLIDGDGTGEDRRLNMLLKQFLKWANSKNDSQETNQIMYDRLMAQFAQCQFAALKNVQTLRMIKEEHENYIKLIEKHEESIEIAKEQIESSKKELIIAKELRKNKMEYDLLTSLIEEQPDRKGTEKHIDIIKKEIDKLTQKQQKMEHKFQKRRNDFTLLMYTIHELKQQLEDENSSASSSSSSESEAHFELNDNNGIMEVSDDDDDDELNNMDGANKFDGHRDKLKDNSSSTESSKEPISSMSMSVDEDAVLELSIEKDDHVGDVAVAS